MAYLSYFQLTKKLKQFHESFLRQRILKTYNKRLQKALWDLKDTHREIEFSNKTPALTKSINTGIWVVGTSNQFFIRGFQTVKKIKKEEVTGKTPFFVKGPFCTPRSIWLNIGFWQSKYNFQFSI